MRLELIRIVIEITDHRSLMKIRYLVLPGKSPFLLRIMMKCAIAHSSARILLHWTHEEPN
jgi:hypothetical protein